jgi:hypothetical protein
MDPPLQRNAALAGGGLSSSKLQWHRYLEADVSHLALVSKHTATFCIGASASLRCVEGCKPLAQHDHQQFNIGCHRLQALNLVGLNSHRIQPNCYRILPIGIAFSKVQRIFASSVDGDRKEVFFINQSTNLRL